MSTPPTHAFVQFDVDRLTKARDWFELQMPDRADMESWAQVIDRRSGSTVRGLAEGDEEHCRTTCCIAGFLVLEAARVDPLDAGAVFSAIQGGINPGRDWGVVAEKLLTDDVWDRTKLFDKGSWPAEHEELARRKGDRVAIVKLLDDILDGRVRLTVAEPDHDYDGEWLDDLGRNIEQ
jgi:hypothetical protein